MFDCFNRKINYLRISVTDRCNLRCSYCMPAEGVSLIHHDDILRYEEIIEVVNEAVKLGINKVRITGGEPLVRKGIESLVASLAAIPEITDLGLTTNGTLLKGFAQKLKSAGLHRINISLDTLDAAKFRTITRGGDLQSVIDGIIAAKEAGLFPVKINCVVEHSSAETDAVAVRNFCTEHGLEGRFIHRMDLTEGSFSIVENGHGGDCRHCNRLRLTANGMIRPCLFSNIQYSIRELGIENALLRAVGNKPEKGGINANGMFYNIGG